MGLSGQEAAAGRTEDHGTQHNARGRDRQGSLACPTRTARRPHDSTASLLTPHRTKRNLPGRTPYKRSTLHQPSQHAASPNATRCTSHRTALPSPSRNSTFCRASGKPNHNCPLLPVSDKQASALTTARDPLQHGTLTRANAPAASTSLPLLSPAVSQPYKIRCAE